MKRNLLERVFERILWDSRFLVMIPVLVSMFIFVLLVFGISIKFYHLVEEVINHWFTESVLSWVISILDVSLLAVIILIFAWWIYELFVSEIDVDDDHASKAKSLIIKSIDELKEKIWKVIVILLIVWLFKQMLLQEPKTQLQMLYMAGIILLMAISLKILSIKK